MSDDSKTAHHSPASEQTSKLKLSCTEKCPFIQVWTHTHTHHHTPSRPNPQRPAARPAEEASPCCDPKHPVSEGALVVLMPSTASSPTPRLGEDAERTRRTRRNREAGGGAEGGGWRREHQKGWNKQHLFWCGGCFLESLVGWPDHTAL